MAIMMKFLLISVSLVSCMYPKVSWLQPSVMEECCICKFSHCLKKNVAFEDWTHFLKIVGMLQTEIGFSR